MRTQIIYESRGRAREYCELAANLYSGCEHNCIYCYAPLALRKTRNSFKIATVRNDIINKFEKDAKILHEKRERRAILLSFTTDPYQPIDIEKELTRQAIKILHKNELKVSVLTKGGKRAERDFDLLSNNPELSEFGSTLVFLDEKDRIQIEPGAAPTDERIKSLIKAHRMNIFTYVSLEPVWYPYDTLALIDKTHEFVDFYKVGKLNYHHQNKEVNWEKFKQDVIEKLESYGKSYYIKKDLMTAITSI